MKKLKENEWVIFEKFCISAKKIALIKGAEIEESLNLFDLTIQERYGRIYDNIGLNLKERNSLNWPNLLVYESEPEILFEIFENLGYLGNPKEMKKLQRAFILDEVHNRLQNLFSEVFAMEKVERLNARNLAMLAIHHNQSMNINNQKQSLPVHKINVQNNVSLAKSSKQFHGIRKNKFSFAYKMAADFLRPYIIKLNKLINFLDPRTSIESFLSIITCTDWTKIMDKIYIGCRTTEFKYVMIHLKKYFSSLSYARIGRSALFISKQGKAITSSNLTTTNHNKILNMHAIDLIFL